jgi:spermidine synthase
MAIAQIRTAKALGVGAAAVLLVASAQILAAHGGASYSFDSAYQSIRIVEDQAENGRMERVLIMGGGRASGVYVDNRETSFEYVRAAEAALAAVKPETVLVIGAAGFTFPRDASSLDWVKQVDAVDVDPTVRRIAEDWFLKQRLPSKVRFLPLSARYAVRKLRKDGAHYGFTFVDPYCGKGIPDELVTVEFFADLRLVSEHTAVNVIMDREMESPFARNMLASFREAFGKVWVKQVKSGDSELTNILVSDWAVEGSAAWLARGDAYRDDRNSADRDHVALIWE